MVNKKKSNKELLEEDLVICKCGFSLLGDVLYCSQCGRKKNETRTNNILFQVNNDENDLKFILNEMTNLEWRALINLLEDTIKEMKKSTKIDLEEL